MRRFFISSFAHQLPIASIHPSGTRMCSMPSMMTTVPQATESGVSLVKMMGWQTFGGSASIVYARGRVVFTAAFLPIG